MRFSIYIVLVVIFVVRVKSKMFDIHGTERPNILNCLRDKAAYRPENGYDHDKTYNLTFRNQLPLDVQMVWEIIDYNKPFEGRVVRPQIHKTSGRHQQIFTLPAFCCHSIYGVKVHYFKQKGRQVNPRWPNAGKDRCDIRYNKRRPTATITGGPKLTLPSNHDIKVSGKESQIYNTVTSGKTKVTWANDSKYYQWSCTQKPESDFCKKFESDKESFTIPKKFVKAGITFNITLFVGLNTTLGESSIVKMFLRNYHEAPRNDTTSQEIDVYNNAAELQITCNKNCPPISEHPNERISTVMTGSCVENCQRVKKEHFLWTIEEQDRPGELNFDYAKNTDTGRTNQKFIVKASTLSPGKYKVTFALNKKSVMVGEAQMKLEFEKPPEFKSCQVDPTSGLSMETDFTFHCDMESNLNYKFEIVYSDGDTVVSGRSPDVFTESFKLKAMDEDEEITIKAISDSKSTAEYKVTVDVKMKEVKDEDELIDDLNKLMEETTTTTPATPDAGDTTTTTQQSTTTEMTAKFNIPEEIYTVKGAKQMKDLRNVIKKITEHSKVSRGNNNSQKFISDLKHKLTANLLNRPLNSTEEVLEISRIYTDLIFGTAKEDEQFDLQASSVCKQLANGMLNFMKDDESVLEKDEDAMKTVQMMSKCVQASIHLDPAGIEEKLPDVPSVPLSVTKPPPDYGAILAEDYADYEYHNEAFESKIDALTATTSNLLNITSVAAKAMALTTAVGEKGKEFEKGPVKIVAVKDTGKSFSNMTVFCMADAITPSKDFEDSPEHPFDILISSFEDDIMWWNVERIEASTNILNIEFWHSTCKERVKEFKKPAQLTLSISKRLDEDFIRGRFRVKKNFSWAPETIESLVRIYRITLPKNMELRVKFRHVPAVEVAFQVAITKLKLATPQDFVNSTEIGIYKKILSIVNSDDTNLWYYLAILPKKDAFEGRRTLKFAINIVGACCIHWKMGKSKWDLACKTEPSMNNSVIKCQCQKFSAIAGHLEKLLVVPQVITNFRAVLRIQISYVVFWCTFCAFLVYCLSIIYTVFKEKRPFYYLADNIQFHHYYYLVVVKTSDWPNSGTTSNVSMKICGETSDSLPHLLNYPDPEKRMLQRCGEDYFVLTTENNLGRIVNIELWSDNSGIKPTWSCSQILIYDYQNHEEWRFPINTVLSAEYDTQFISKEPFEEKERKCCRLKFVNQHHSWCVWEDRGESFSYMKRLTVLLSTVLTLFSFTLLAYGNPGFVLEDGIEDFDVYTVDVFTLWIGPVTAMGSCVLHTVLTQIFLASKIQYSKYGEQADKLRFGLTVTCWLLTIILIVASTSHLLTFGFWLPHFTSLRWVTSVTIGLVTDIFIYEPLLIFFKNCFPQKPINPAIETQYHEMAEEVDRQRTWLHSSFGTRLFRRYFEHVYVPLPAPQVRELKKGLQLRRMIVRELQDLVMFAGYVIILYTIVLMSRQRLAVISNDNMYDIINGKLHRSWNFARTTSMADIYSYIKKTLIPSTQPRIWYGKYVMHDPGLMIDAQTKILGVIRLRQHRMPFNVCSVAKIMTPFNFSCSPEYSWLSSEQSKFGFGWGALDRFLVFDRLRHIWEYHSDAETAPFIGKFSVYPGGGYTVFLGRTFYNSMINFNTLLKKFWIDPGTRSVFMEFLTYNVNYNIFNAVRIVIEQSATGLIGITVDISVTRMLFVHRELTKTFFVLTICFGIWIGMIFLRMSLGMMKNFKTMARDPWLIMDLVIICLSGCCIAIQEIRTLSVEKYLKKLEKAMHNEFVNYFDLLFYDDIVTVLAAILICLATIRLWKFFRFGLMFKTMEKALALSAGPLGMLTIAYLVFLYAFGGCGSVLFGADVNEFHSVSTTVTELFMLTLQPGKFRPVSKLGRRSSAPFFITFMMTVTIFLNFFIATIILAYAQAQIEVSNEEHQYSIKDYIIETGRWIPAIIKYTLRRLKGGMTTQHEEIKAFNPKPDEIRYENSIAISKKKLEVMRLVSIAALTATRPRKRRPNFALMAGIAAHFAVRKPDDSRKNAFFKGSLEGVSFKILVPEQRIEMAAAAANKIAVLQDIDLRPKVVKKKHPLMEGNLQMMKELHRDIINVRNDVNDILDSVNKM